MTLSTKVEVTGGMDVGSTSQTACWAASVYVDESVINR